MVLILLLEKLQIGNINKIKQKIRQLNLAFSTRDKKSRFPDDSLSKLYKFTPSPEFCIHLKKLKLRKNKSKLLNQNQKNIPIIEKKNIPRHASAHLIRRSSDKISVHNVSIISIIKTTASTYNN